jgi:hypothetical protein
MDDETTGKMPEQTTGETPDAEQTVVEPPADEGATQVLGGESADLTQVMPAAGGAGAPPSSPIQPTLMMTHPKKNGGGGRTWIWVVVALVVIAALAAAGWFFLLRPDNGNASAGDSFVGTWSPINGSGGGLIIAKSGGDFKVTQYDAELVAIGSTTATLANDELTASVDASALGLTGVSGTVKGILAHEASSDQLSLRFTSGSLSSTTEYFMRADVLRPASPSPSPTPSPTPSPSPSPSGSPSPSTSPTASSDQQIIDAIVKIQVGVITWATNNNNLYPASAEVSQSGGVAQYVSPWPTNPVTNLPMTPGTQTGDYTYEQLNGGQGYKLTGYLSKGLTYTVP